MTEPIDESQPAGNSDAVPDFMGTIQTVRGDNITVERLVRRKKALVVSEKLRAKIILLNLTGTEFRNGT
jgi:hypothetical protein